MSVSDLHCAELAGRYGKRIGRITLDRPKALNALTLDMIEALHRQLRAWDADADIAAIVIDADHDRVFSAGGDIVALYEGITGGGDPDYPDRFFTQEYRLLHSLHRLATPVVAWGHGLIAGGGLGLFRAASHRVVTDEAKLTMPEVSIGLFPDCGATWFFNRMPRRLGLFIGLTGAQLGARDALASGLAERAIAHAAKDQVIDALAGAEDWRDAPTTVDRILRRISQEQPAGQGESALVRHADTIREVTQAPTLAGIDAALRKLAERDDPWLAQAGRNVANACPVSLHLVYRQLHEGRYLSLKQAFMRELKMAQQCCRHPDFAEGVRALLIDRDKNPHWLFDAVAEVPRDHVDAHFRAPWDGDHPLRDLPDITP